MAIAKHITLAKMEGAERGMDFYMSQPISQRQQAFKDIARKRTRDSQIATYCQRFNILTPAAVDEIRDRNKDATQTIAEAANDNESVFSIFTPEQIAAMTPAQIKALAEAQVNSAGDEPVSDLAPAVVEYGFENPHPDAITRHQAWTAMNGQDSEFKYPNDPEAPATNGQIGRMNVLGLLSIVEA